MSPQCFDKTQNELERETFRKLDIDEWSGTAQQVRKRVKVGDPREEYRFPLPSPPAAAAAAADAVL